MIYIRIDILIMKRLYFIISTALLLAGCTFEEFREPLPKVESKTFSIEQAKAFFENDYTGKITKSSSVKKNGKLHPGDFTPLWDKAVYSEKGGTAAYDVSIMTDRRIAATRLTADGAQRVRVYQKLVVTQSTSSGKMTAYIMSLIPNDDQGHFPKSFSSRKSYRGNYSGIVVYTTVDNGALVRVQEYKDGKLHRGANLTSGKDSYLDQCRKAVEILRGIKLSSKRLILTKSGEDWDDSWDDDDYDGWDINDFEDLGYGIYTDGEGNYYIDIDGDGDLDMETLAPGGVTDDMEKEEEEDPWPPTSPEEPEEDDNDDWMEDNDDDSNNQPGFNAPVYNVTSQDKLARPGMPTEMTVNQTQVQSTCAFSALSFISSILGDNYNQGEFLLYYINLCGIPLWEFDGVDPSLLPTLVEHYYDYNPVAIDILTICSQIDNGNVLLGVYSYGDDNAHAIVIIGYNNTQELIYVDPVDGKTHSLDSNSTTYLISVGTVTEN